VAVGSWINVLERFSYTDAWFSSYFPLLRTTHNSQPIISFVNAILRRVDREGLAVLETKTTVYDNIAPWLVKRWKSSYGNEKSKLIAESFMVEPIIFLSVNHDPETCTDQQKRLEKVQLIQKEFGRNFSEEEVEILPQYSIRVPNGYFGSVAQWPLYEEGQWWVQDVSATLPALALYKGLLSSGNNGDNNDKPSSAVRNMRVVDLCSSPGGKTAQLCSLGFGEVTAVEVSKRRIQPLKENLARLGMTDRVKVVVADGREWLPSGSDVCGSFSSVIDGVLVDAPCSATGVGSRRPDVLRKAEDMDELLETQRQLAAHTADTLLAPGGIMVYATCSLLQQESEDQIKWLLHGRTTGETRDGTEVATMETMPFQIGEIPGFDNAIDENGWLRVLPGVLPGTLSRCDGFFVARLRKTR
jgi:16S rRNA (cytosine967-C5)-methyltransferase